MKASVVYLLGMILYGFSAFACADARGVFFLSGGDAEVEKEKDGFSGTDTGFKIGSGFRVTENSGIEIYWAKYGEAEDTVVLPALGSRDVKVELYSLAFQYVHFFPVAGSVELLARLGAVFWKSEYDVSSLGVTDDDGIHLIAGAGTEIDMSDAWALRVEWEYSDLRDYEVNFVSVGIAHYFD